MSSSQVPYPRKRPVSAANSTTTGNGGTSSSPAKPGTAYRWCHTSGTPLRSPSKPAAAGIGVTTRGSPGSAAAGEDGPAPTSADPKATENGESPGADAPAPASSSRNPDTVFSHFPFHPDETYNWANEDAKNRTGPHPSDPHPPVRVRPLVPSDFLHPMRPGDPGLQGNASFLSLAHEATQKAHFYNLEAVHQDLWMQKTKLEEDHKKMTAERNQLVITTTKQSKEIAQLTEDRDRLALLEAARNTELADLRVTHHLIQQMNDLLRADLDDVHARQGD